MRKNEISDIVWLKEVRRQDLLLMVCQGNLLLHSLVAADGRMEDFHVLMRALDRAMLSILLEVKNCAGGLVFIMNADRVENFWKEVYKGDYITRQSTSCVPHAGRTQSRAPVTYTLTVCFQYIE